MPAVPTPEEQNYVEALLKVYKEACKDDSLTVDSVPNKFSPHFRAQRRLFYCAEGLNRFSRDKLPGAFDDLLNQVEVGISTVIASPHVSGLDRLSAALNTANVLHIGINPLKSRIQAGDLQGSCHHLANQDRIKWVNEDDKSI